jgi:hypothetical protein
MNETARAIHPMSSVTRFLGGVAGRRDRLLMSPEDKTPAIIGKDDRLLFSTLRYEHRDGSRFQGFEDFGNLMMGTH